ncbi:uncharacterized protein K452DRAFT_151952 [Aplosporella prunicola CBS 121167]|uniref:Uncharacterized protein n=1 Tax=Aplosporella prunicola CBS 121167 TaxID=1176127 RepID=A0A6A6BNB8_9PEZI|nr:uncharacterized protein K452DRAFT_151952 [Aplosporella prunicola CBS 121167]KAF2144041.1 hypothetical protein K452DRAFT_151952 [Aplosporella prunicola CBS 121167]
MQAWRRDERWCQRPPVDPSVGTPRWLRQRVLRGIKLWLDEDRWAVRAAGDFAAVVSLPISIIPKLGSSSDRIIAVACQEGKNIGKSLGRRRARGRSEGASFAAFVSRGLGAGKELPRKGDMRCAAMDWVFAAVAADAACCCVEARGDYCDRAATAALCGVQGAAIGSRG